MEICDATRRVFTRVILSAKEYFLYVHELLRARYKGYLGDSTPPEIDSLRGWHGTQARRNLAWQPEPDRFYRRLWASQPVPAGTGERCGFTFPKDRIMGEGSEPGDREGQNEGKPGEVGS
jgi:hypothetical protein